VEKIPFDPANPSIEAARRIVLARLRHDPQWHALDNSGEGFDPYVEYKGAANRGVLNLHAREVFWQFVVEGILAPGWNSSNLELPWFRITSHGRSVISAEEPQPYDPTGYLATVRRLIANPDETVIAYLAESVAAFNRGAVISSAITIGIAAERVFDLLCGSMLDALMDAQERGAFAKLLERFAIKPRVEWLHAKLQGLQDRRVPGLPENATMMLTLIYDLLRQQRNELGHPRERPPQIRREDAFVSLQIFPQYYGSAERVRAVLAGTKV
jgi:hypothetical protein